MCSIRRLMWWGGFAGGGPLSDLVGGGALVLVRRSLFFCAGGSWCRADEFVVGGVGEFGQCGVYPAGGGVVGADCGGDPSFFRAYTVSDAAPVSVSVGGAGNAGCAGVVVTSGTVNGSLSTSGIDALRFADGGRRLPVRWMRR